jgi:predicted nucleic acid-binding Zn finger protein
MQYRRIKCQSSNGNYFIHRALQRHLQLAVSSVISQLKNVLQNRKYQCKKLISLNLSVKDDKYDTCKTANIKNLGGEILLSDLAVTSLPRLYQFTFVK